MMKTKNYFNEDIVQSIDKFNSSTIPSIKNKIFRTEIYPTLYELSYKIGNKILKKNVLISNDIELQDVVNECVSHLYSMCIPNYQEDLGKAFSYFTRSSINFMSKYNKDLLKHQSEDLLVLDYDKKVTNTAYLKESHHNLATFFDLFIDVYEKELNRLYKGDQLLIADAILEIFRTRNNIEDFEKTMLYIYIREITGLETIQITPVVKKVKAHFYSLYRYYLKNDTINKNLLIKNIKRA